MSFGISTTRAHVDTRIPPSPQPEEIDWDAYLTWSAQKSPAFAGRNFLGQPAPWAHGEGGEAQGPLASLMAIAPLQAADRDRQEAFGEIGERYGREDARALGDAIQACLVVGDLSLPGDFLNVFLEVADGTVLAPDYWAAWASAVHDYLLFVPVGAMWTQAQPLRPSICCAFPLAQSSGKYEPDADVTACLDAAGERLAGKQTRCFGFWARADVTAYHVLEPPLDWGLLAKPSQKQEDVTVEVRVLLWRYMAAADPQNPVPQVGKMTLDAANERPANAAAPANVKPVTGAMLAIENWSAPFDRPSQVGVDKGRSLATEIGCLALTNATISHLPEGSAHVADGPAANPNVTGKTTFAGRYYSTPRTQQQKRPKDVSAAEARAISKRGVEIVAVWQAAVPYNDIPVYLTTSGNGTEDARNAFAYAANRIGQPPYTPVYFAVDTNVLDVTLLAPYFVDVGLGYDQYLLDQRTAGREPVPYYIGVYASLNVLEHLYARTLASHFWQAWPPTWGDTYPGERSNGDAWLHANLWQVCLSGNACIAASGVNGCRDAAANAPGEFVDINVAWGDVGGWKIA